MNKLWEQDGYCALIKALLAEENLDLDMFDVRLFHDEGGKANTGYGINVSLATQWDRANAVVLIEKKTRIIAMIFHGLHKVENFYSGHGFTEQGFLRLWKISD